MLHQLGLDHQQFVYEHDGREEIATDDVVTGAHIHPEIIESPVML